MYKRQTVTTNPNRRLITRQHMVRRSECVLIKLIERVNEKVEVRKVMVRIMHTSPVVIEHA